MRPPAASKHRIVSFKASKADHALITKIVNRALLVTQDGADRLELDMDITACHCNGTPLDLKKLLKADDFNFFHDVWGIRKHLDRDTGQLLNYFLPRCAKSTTPRRA